MEETKRHPGGRTQARKKAEPRHELSWVKSLMLDHAAWSALVKIPAIERYELEYQISPSRGNLGMARRTGFPRIDAIAHHADGSVSIIEAKLECAPQSIMSAVGQLLYYKTVMERTEGVSAASMIVAAPAVPPMVGTLIEIYNLPIRLLMVTPNSYEGLVPRFGAHVREQ